MADIAREECTKPLEKRAKDLEELASLWAENMQGSKAFGDAGKIPACIKIVPRVFRAVD